MSVKDTLMAMDLASPDIRENIDRYITCRERMKMAQEDLRELRELIGVPSFVGGA